MIKTSKILGMCAFSALLLITSCAKTQGETQSDSSEKHELTRVIEGFLADERFSDAYWGVKIESLDTGEVWFEQNANKIMMPASNEKIPTAAGALLALGPDFRFTTKFLTNGSIAGDTLNGDLIAWSNGDPTHYTRYGESPTKVFEDLVDFLESKNITKINGRIIGNDNAFEDNHLGYGWTHGGLDSWWSAPVGALQVNENYVDLKVTPPDTITGQATIEPNIDTDYVTIINNVEVVESGRTWISTNRPYGANVITVSGQVQAGGNSTERSPAIEDPTMFYVTVMNETLEKAGIDVMGEAVDIDDLPDSEIVSIEKVDNVLFEYKSVPLTDILTILMKRSQNLYAETMPRVVAYEKNGYGDFSDGAGIIKDELSQFGLDPDAYLFRDGSGLSRYNFIAPNHLVTILKGMHNHEYAEMWKDFQPIAGVDGTLRNRMKGTPAEGNVRAKTGTISNVRGLSGYVTTADGEELVFSFLVNNHSSSSAATEDVTDGILAAIAGYSSGN